MKNETLNSAVIPGLFAAAALVLSISLPASVVLIGAATVLTVALIAAQEYRISWKRISGR